MISCYLQQLSISWRYCMLKTTTTSGQFIDPHSTWESNGWFQYFLYLCFVFNTAATFLDMSLMKSTRKSFGIRSHSVTILTYSSRMPRGTVSCPVNFFFKCCHKFSIGLRSVDCTNYFNTSIPLVSSHLRAIREVCIVYFNQMCIRKIIIIIIKDFFENLYCE